MVNLTASSATMASLSSNEVAELGVVLGAGLWVERQRFPGVPLTSSTRSALMPDELLGGGLAAEAQLHVPPEAAERCSIACSDTATHARTLSRE
jgi:hypothetical protein